MENLKAIDIKPADLAALDDEALDALAAAIAQERKVGLTDCGMRFAARQIPSALMRRP